MALPYFLRRHSAHLLGALAILASLANASDVSDNNFSLEVSMNDADGNINTDNNVFHPSQSRRRRLDSRFSFEYDVNDDDTVTFTIELEGDGYISFGTSTNGYMFNAEVIIGQPSLPQGKNNPSKYLLKTPFNVLEEDRMPDSQQTLIDPSITKKDGKTILKYTKLLVEEGEIPIDANGKNTFIWAYGPDANRLIYHENKGVAEVDFFTKETLIVENPYQAHWKAHGILAFVAWGVLVPIAISFSLLRDLLPKQFPWFRIHQIFNVLALVLTIVSFSLAVIAYETSARDNFDGTHERVGLVVFFLIIFQILGGIFRAHAPAPAAVCTKTDRNDTGESFEDEIEENDKNAPVKKSMKRIIWEIMHRALGLGLFGMSLYQLQSGLGLYATIYNSDSLEGALWGYIGALLGVVLVLFLYSKFRARS